MAPLPHIVEAAVRMIRCRLAPDHISLISVSSRQTLFINADEQGFTIA
jgi:hypothetical protein